MLTRNNAGTATLRKISFTVNGRPVAIEIDVRESLLDVLRDRLEYTGVKQGCSVGECGACTVLIDGTPVNSCIYLAAWADGKEVRTIEGIAQDGQLSPVQEAFVDEGAIQCGFCTPGVVLSATAMVESGKRFTHAEVRRELSGHLCRCTGYQKIVDAAERALREAKQLDE
ncbi:xanthine dehydrogenase subunit XdhC [Mesoterricola sediminis]|uniref:Xanthine dehydrogenase n=1 Tax=Mesoterricola sediminis TaxID=2927980 RepID=A0AA48KD66_9BACT|nr:xanthine dehydrogenase subunit XdhC [Mesoterricola sediminis]BDU76760.1 xanthine dehydrogenase [Mesoterricola sediminis]